MANPQDDYIDKRKFYDEGSWEDDDPKCSVFGCGRTLSLHEQRCGSKCINHSKDGSKNRYNREKIWQAASFIGSETAIGPQNKVAV